VTALLRRQLSDPRHGDLRSPGLRDVLGRLIDATYRPLPAIANLARSVTRGGKVTGGRGLQSHRSGLSFAGRENYRSFLGMYEFIRTACGLLGGDTSLTPGTSHEC